MQELLERVWRDQGFTAVLVTHDVAEAVALADRVVVLDARADRRSTSTFRCRGRAATAPPRWPDSKRGSSRKLLGADHRPRPRAS